MHLEVEGLWWLLWRRRKGIHSDRPLLCGSVWIGGVSVERLEEEGCRWLC